MEKELIELVNKLNKGMDNLPANFGSMVESYQIEHVVVAIFFAVLAIILGVIAFVMVKGYLNKKSFWWEKNIKGEFYRTAVGFYTTASVSFASIVFLILSINSTRNAINPVYYLIESFLNK